MLIHFNCQYFVAQVLEKWNYFMIMWKCMEITLACLVHAFCTLHERYFCFFLSLSRVNCSQTAQGRTLRQLPSLVGWGLGGGLVDCRPASTCTVCLSYTLHSMAVRERERVYAGWFSSPSYTSQRSAGIFGKQSLDSVGVILLHQQQQQATSWSGAVRWVLCAYREMVEAWLSLLPNERR